MSATSQVSLELSDLLGELRRRHWTLIRWGDRDEPELVAAMFRWQTCADVLILRDQDDATAYRVVVLGDGGVFNPAKVVYQYHSTSLWTLRAILGLPGPGEPGAPMSMESPSPKCMVPGELPKPVLIRPLAQYAS